ncbi:Rieske (2Fe-2S) protein [Dactylosporangium fulvum]|uniref:Rieske (2Fe-2S) protein n=1 Tax=Dactylosporangium fulvum TaxID=53359 RepID=A0ABY5VSH0_9ACTN|nr:Rieske (2Fe-2S) protein [Dactylosporangium fulvum]UWP80094.1 Rieske (2Fe-2S) protein [Dactylosporangium fulvum]
MPKYIVARVGEISEGERRLVTIGGREVAVFNVAGSYHAVRNRCPHMGGPLCAGNMVGTLESPAPGVYEYDPVRSVVRCPWHQWEFDVRTGQSWFDPQHVRTRAYQVSVEQGGDIVANEERVAVEQAAAKAQGARRVPGPYLAETYPVIVNEEYVLVELR